MSVKRVLHLHLNQLNRIQANNNKNYNVEMTLKWMFDADKLVINLH